MTPNAQIASAIDLLAARLLGSHVSGSPEYHAGAGRRSAERRRMREVWRRGNFVFERLGKTEIEDLHRSLRCDLHISRLEVPVNDRLLVRRLQRFGDLQRNPEGFFNADRSLLDPFRQGLAIDELEHERGTAARFLNAVNRSNVLVIQRSQQLRFACKAGHAIRIEHETIRQNLQRHIAVKPRIPRPIYVAHSARTDWPQYLVRSKSGARLQRHGLIAKLYRSIADRGLKVLAQPAFREIGDSIAAALLKDGTFRNLLSVQLVGRLPRYPLKMRDQTDSDTKARLTKRSLTIAKFLCFTAAAFPVLAILGWIFDIRLLRQIDPSLPVMHPNTALGLLLVVSGVLLTAYQERFRRGSSAACALGAAAALTGLLTLAEYIAAGDLGIDRVFFGAATIPPELFPGRSSPQTAANLVLFGAALLVFNLRFLPIRAGQLFVLMAGANATLMITGYIFSATQFYGFPQLGTGMAVHTAAAFILMAVALLLSRPGDGIMSLVTSGTRSSAMARRILLTGILAPPLVGILTRIGVIADWYSASVQTSLFVVVLGGLLFGRHGRRQGNRSRMNCWPGRHSRSLRPQTRN